MLQEERDRPHLPDRPRQPPADSQAEEAGLLRLYLLPGGPLQQ